MTRHNKHVIYTSIFVGTTVLISSAAFVNLGFYLSHKRYNFDYLTDLRTYSKKNPFDAGEITDQDEVDALSLKLSRDDVLFEIEHDMQYLINSAPFAYINCQWNAHFDSFNMRTNNNHLEFSFNLRINYANDDDPLNSKISHAVFFFPWISFEYLPDIIPSQSDSAWDRDNYINALVAGEHKGIIGYKVSDMRMNMFFTYVNVWDTRDYADFLFMYNNYINNFKEEDGVTQWWPSHWYFNSYFFQEKTMTIPNA